MELVTKVVDPLNNFWVEKYNQEAKDFFLKLGFKEVKRGGFELTIYLEFQGSGMFGKWNDEEKEKIFKAVNDISMSKSTMKLFNWDGRIYEMNPYN